MLRHNDYTYFVFRKGEYIETPRQYEATAREYSSTVSAMNFPLADFPLRTVWAISLSRKIDITTVDPTVLTTTAIPSGIHAVLGPPPGAMITEFYDRAVWIDGRQPEPIKCRAPSVLDNPEIVVCAQEELVTSARAVSGAKHRFLTTSGRRTYCMVHCKVELFVDNWIEIAGCLDAFDEMFAPADLFIGDPRSQINRFMFSQQKRVESALRARFEECASREGPRSGSFIPCTVLDAFRHIDCHSVLQILGGPMDQEHTCILHMLCDGGGVDIYPGMRILHRLVLKGAQDSAALRESMTELGTIRQVVTREGGEVC